MARTAHDPTTRWPARLALVLLALAPGCGPGSQRGAELLAGLRLPEDPLQEPRVSAAIDDAWRALVADPADARRWRRLAGVLDAHHHPEAARAGYRAALELEPGDVWTTYQLACLLEESGREPAEAARLLEAFLARRPEHVSALLRLAGVLRAGGREEEALAANRRATELAPRLAIAWRALGQTLVERGEGDEALAALRRAEALSPEPDGPTHAALARALQLTGAEEEARRQAELARDYRNVLPLPDALRAEVLALGVGSQDCYDRAKALMREGSFERALDQLQLAREGLPEHAMLELRAAICLEELGRPEEARRHLEAARALRDGLARRADASGAGEALGELVELDRTLSRYWSMYGRPEPAHGPFLERAAAHVRAGRAAEALAEFAAAQELAPLGPRTLMNWGSAARAAGDAELAIDRYRAALALDPGHATTRLLLAAVLAERGRIEEARAAFEQARRLEPEHELVRALAPSLERPPR